jgi:hypothetical protein
MMVEILFIILQWLRRVVYTFLSFLSVSWSCEGGAASFRQPAHLAGTSCHTARIIVLLCHFILVIWIYQVKDYFWLQNEKVPISYKELNK